MAASAGLPLSGTTVIEAGGIGPVPFAGMLLADLGARVVRVERPGPSSPIVAATTRALGRGKAWVYLDLRVREDLDLLRRMCRRADVLLEGFRPGVMERLGLGPEEVLESFPQIVYARVTGWGRRGRRAGEAGHDINYLALSGLLNQIGQADLPPTVPLNVVADFAGGAMFAVTGILAALLDRTKSSVGQVVDTSMLHGVAYLQSMSLGLRSEGLWSDARGENFVDGSRPYYTTYATSDGQAVAVGCIEPEFFRAFLTVLGLDPEEWPQDDPDLWAVQRTQLTALFATHTRDHWAAAFAGSDACVTPILSIDEALEDDHVMDEQVFTGVRARPAPAFSGHAMSEQSQENPVEGLAEWLGLVGLSPEEIRRLTEAPSVLSVDKSSRDA